MLGPHSYEMIREIWKWTGYLIVLANNYKILKIIKMSLLCLKKSPSVLQTESVLVQGFGICECAYSLICKPEISTCGTFSATCRNA